MDKLSRIQLYNLLDLLEEYEDEIDYGRAYTPFSNVVSRDIKSLINVDTEEAEVSKAVRDFIRKMTSAGIQLVDKVKSESMVTPLEDMSVKSGDITKQFSISNYEKWRDGLKKVSPQLERDFYNKLIIPVSVSYGKGFERAMKDLGVKPNNNWLYMPGHSIERMTALNLIKNMSDNLTWEMQSEIIEGIRKGEGSAKIAKRLRTVHDAPKHVIVKPKIDPKTGNVIRKGYEYNISNKRYTEIIARTETNRATNGGRIDGYERSKAVKSLEWLTAGDQRVCPICEPHDREVFLLEESKGILPAHALGRCTWTVHEYIEDRPSNSEVSARYDVDDIDKVVNTVPITLPTTKTDVSAAIAGFKRHLRKFNLNNKEGYSRVFTRLEKQLKSIGVTNAGGWDPNNINDLYTLHTIKNTRLHAQRTLKKKLPKISIEKEAIIDGDKSLLGTYFLDKETGEQLIRFSTIATKQDIAITSLHETVGHSIRHSQLTFNQKFEWTHVSQESKRYVTSYAKLGGVDEDFAETLAYALLNPSRVQKIVPEKYSYMEKYLFKKKVKISR